MTSKNNFIQQRLWMPPIQPDGLDLPATKRQELTAALADLLLQFAQTSTAIATNQEQGGQDGHDELNETHA